MYYNRKITQKTKARFSRLLQHPALKWRGPILISALHKFVTYLLTAPGPRWDTEQSALKSVDKT